MSLEEDLKYLAAEAFEFHLTVNPHAGCFETVEDETSDHDGGPRGDWLSEEQHEAALDTGRFISGLVYPNGSVSFYLVYGTDYAGVIAECARLCREDRDRWTNANGPTQPKPLGRNSDRQPL